MEQRGPQLHLREHPLQELQASRQPQQRQGEAAPARAERGAAAGLHLSLHSPQSGGGRQSVLLALAGPGGHSHQSRGRCGRHYLTGKAYVLLSVCLTFLLSYLMSYLLSCLMSSSLTYCLA